MQPEHVAILRAAIEEARAAAAAEKTSIEEVAEELAQHLVDVDRIVASQDNLNEFKCTTSCTGEGLRWLLADLRLINEVLNGNFATVSFLAGARPGRVRDLEQRLKALDRQLLVRDGAFIVVGADGGISATVEAGPDAIAELGRQVELEERCARQGVSS